MTRIKAIMLALRIEYHWWRIKQSRTRFDALYAVGLPLSSPQVQQLNRRTSKHTAQVMLCEKKYREQYTGKIGGVLF